jgi:acyl CoA:acetate/3-ketoacid CoA transferase beta subunit
MTLIELADGVTVDEIKAKTAADFKVALNGGQSNTTEVSYAKQPKGEPASN